MNKEEFCKVIYCADDLITAAIRIGGICYGDYVEKILKPLNELQDDEEFYTEDIPTINLWFSGKGARRYLRKLNLECTKRYIPINIETEDRGICFNIFGINEALKFHIIANGEHLPKGIPCVDFDVFTFHVTV